MHLQPKLRQSVRLSSNAYNKVSTNTNLHHEHKCQDQLNIQVIWLPSHVLFSAADAGIDSWSFQTLPAPVQSQYTPSTTLPASPVVADLLPAPEWPEHDPCHQELLPFQQTK